MAPRKAKNKKQKKLAFGTGMRVYGYRKGGALVQVERDPRAPQTRPEVDGKSRGAGERDDD